MSRLALYTESKPNSPGKTINAFIVEKGKPLINPVQKP